MKGPVPFGVVFSPSSVSSEDSIAMLITARFAGSAASGALRVRVTVFSSVASTAVTEARELRDTAAVASAAIASSECFTSSDPNVLPSANVTPSRRWKVRVRPSSETSQDSARPGTTLRSSSNSVRVPYRFCSTLTAWNWVAFQGKSVSGSLVTPMTRSPPAAPADGWGSDAGAEQPVITSAKATPVAVRAPNDARRAVLIADSSWMGRVAVASGQALLPAAPRTSSVLVGTKSTRQTLLM